MTWLVKVVRRLEVPAVITEEDPERNGATFAPIAAGWNGWSRKGSGSTHCKGLAFEWTRTLENSRSVLRDPAVGEPPFRR